MASSTHPTHDYLESSLIRTVGKQLASTMVSLPSKLTNKRRLPLPLAVFLHCLNQPSTCAYALDYGYE